MRTYKLEQWYRIPTGERVELNTNSLWGTHRFVKRTRHLRSAYQEVQPLLVSMDRSSYECWNVGSGYGWEPKSMESYFLAVSMQDEFTALQFELTFC